MAKTRILVVDDEAAIRDSLRMTLEYEGYEFIGAATGPEGLALGQRESFLAGRGGQEIVAFVFEGHPQRVADRRFVIDDEYARAWHGSSGSVGSRQSVAARLFVVYPDRHELTLIDGR